MEFIVFSENSGLYLFSALLQANAAILAIGGVFYIFRIQSLHGIIEFIKVTMCSAGITSSAKEKMLKFELMTTIEKNNYATLLIEKMPEDQIALGYCNWNQMVQEIERMKSAIIFATILLALGIITNMVMLSFAYHIHKYCSTSEYLFFILVIVLQILILFFVIYGIIVSLKRYKGRKN